MMNESLLEGELGRLSKKLKGVEKERDSYKKRLETIEQILKKMTCGTDWMANRYDTDNTHTLCLYRDDETVDIIVPKDGGIRAEEVILLDEVE